LASSRAPLAVRLSPSTFAQFKRLAML